MLELLPAQKGEKGESGYKGSDGNTGLSGFPGGYGPQGSPGEKGNTGNVSIYVIDRLNILTMPYALQQFHISYNFKNCNTSFRTKRN